MDEKLSSDSLERAELDTERQDKWANMSGTESWSDHLQEAARAIEQAAAEQSNDRARLSPISLAKTKITYRDQMGVVRETTNNSDRFFSHFDRYPSQKAEIMHAMKEALNHGRPLRVVNIGVAQGQEALEYIQMASDMVGEQSIGDALDLELVENAVKTEIAPNYRAGGISETSANYLRGVFNSQKAHFDTSFEEFVKGLSEKGEKRDVILFNNVIQHLNYDAPKEQMLNNMRNMANVVADGGMLCMSCNQYGKKGGIYDKITALFDATTAMLEESGFECRPLNNETSGGYQVLFKKTKPTSAT